MQGKLISFTPLLQNGVHSTFQGKNGLLYKFTVTLDADGKQYVGTANSTKQQPTWKVGEKYLFEHSTSGANNEYSNIKGLKPVDGYGSKSKLFDPSFSIQKCFEAAVECTLMFFEINPDLYISQEVEDQLLNAVYKHIVGSPETSEARRWMNISGMRLSIAKMRANGLFGKSEDDTLTSWMFRQAKAISDAMEDTVKETIKTHFK